MNKFLTLFFIPILVLNTNSCITPPNGVCAYNTGDKGELHIISIEEKNEIDLKCQNRTTIKFKFYQDGKTDNITYSQDYPDYFIKNNDIKIRTYNALIMKPINTCNKPLNIFTFVDYKESFGYMCRS
jgi:hypothetical protein